MIINYRAHLLAVCFWGTILSAPVAHAADVHDVSGLLKDQFRHSERVSYERVKLSQEERASFEKRLSRKLSKLDYVVFVASTRGRVDGYALVDEERGQHELITFAAFFDPQGRITRQEVIAYREPYGDGIRQERFRKQFYGRTAVSGFTLGKDIDSISGATISAGAMCVGIQRATLLVDLVRQKALKRSSLAAL